MQNSLPDSIQDPTQLEQLLSEPTSAAVAAMRQLPGDVLLLGAGGKMGPSLARMVNRASRQAGVERRVIAVSRFTTPDPRDSLERDGIETIAGDLLDERFIGDLPDAPLVIFMTGAKIGTASQAAATWAMNVWLPSLVCRRFRGSRLLAFSTGNVYPLVPVDGGGSVEDDELAPVGEYGMSALGRERIFEYFSRTLQIPTAIVRLNYAVEMRYGVLVDLAKAVLAEQPIDVSMGYANVIWQGDANAMAVAALADANAPPFVVNVAGPEMFAVADVCQHFAEQLGRPLNLRGAPAATALLNNARRAHERYGPPRVTLERLIGWIADWLRRDGVTWSKPTHFEVRDGKF